MNAVFLGVWTLQVLMAIVIAMLLLLGTLTLLASVWAWGVPADDMMAPPLLPIALLMSFHQGRSCPAWGHSASMLSRAPPGASRGPSARPMRAAPAG